MEPSNLPRPESLKEETPPGQAEQINIPEAARKFINLEVIALAFLLPLFFLPITTEFFEFQKLTLLAVAVTLGLLAWGIKAALSGSLGVRRTPFDIPILALWLTTLITTVLSEHAVTSIAGHYARWHPSLITITIFTAFYFLLTSNLERWSLRYITYALLGSAGLAALLFLPQYFGANVFGQDWSAARTFTPLGSLTVLALLLGVTIPLALRGIITRSQIWKKLASCGLSLLLLITLILLNSAAGWAAFAVSLIVSFTGILRTRGYEKIKQSWPYLLVTFVAFVTFVALILVPSIRAHTPFAAGSPREIGLDLHSSWSISATSFRQRPVWGSGPSTFLFDFTRYKPLRFNYTPLWSIRFDKPISEYLLAFAEMGALGVLAYLFLIAVFVRTMLKTKDPKFLALGGAVLAAFFFTCSTVTSHFLLLLALASSGKVTAEATERGKRNYKGFTFLGLTLFFAILLGLGIYRGYSAETHFAQSILAFRGGNLEAAYNHQLRVLSSFPWRDIYHTSFAQINFTMANNSLAGKAELTEEERNTVQLLVAQAVQEAKRAAELSPLNVGNWESLALTYQNLFGFAEGAEDWAVNSYLQAINLDLFNPTLRISLGGLFYRQKDLERAIGQFQAAVNLKNNHANAHYNLGSAYKEAGKIDLAIQEIEIALRLTPVESAGYDEAKAILDELKKSQQGK